MKQLFYLAAFALFLSGCKPHPDPETPPSGAYSKGAWVLNEGMFMAGNASVDFYHRDKQEVETNIFSRVNARPLGDVLQSMTLEGDKYMAVINNSQRVEALNKHDFKTSGVITGFTSPRYYLPLNDTKAYVSDLYAHGIWIVDARALSITGKIDFVTGKDTAFKDWTEQMARYENKVFVCAVKAEQVLVLNSETDRIIDTVQLLAEPQWLVNDKNNKIWVLCSGAVDGRSSHLFRIDLLSHKIEKQFTFSQPGAGPSRLKINAAGDALYYIHTDVYRMQVDASVLPAEPLIRAAGRSFYGLGIDPFTDEIYIGDALDHVQKGLVYRYSAAGELMDEFPVGVAPADFLFVE